MRRSSLVVMGLFISTVSHAEDCNFQRRAEVTCSNLTPEKMNSLLDLTEKQVQSALHSQGMREDYGLHFYGMAEGNGVYTGGVNISFTNGISDVVSATLTREEGDQGAGMTLLRFVANNRTGFRCFDGDAAQKC